MNQGDATQHSSSKIDPESSPIDMIGLGAIHIRYTCEMVIIERYTKSGDTIGICSVWNARTELTRKETPCIVS